jgi:hypothetical protein
VERLEILETLAAADERDRHPDDRHHRERRAAARVAIELAQHDAGDAHAAVELAGALDGVLARHRVGDVEQIDRLDRRLDGLELGHQRVVDVQPARRVDDDDVEAEIAGFRDRALRAHHRVEFARRVVHAQPGLFAQHVQLLDSRRPPHVGRHQQRVASLRFQPASQLAAGRRLARALQAEHQQDARPAIGRLQAALRVAEQRQHLVADNANDLLARRQTAEDLLIERAIAHTIDEGLDNLEVDVGFEQRQPDFPEGGLDRRLGETGLAADRPENVLQAIAERVEHPRPLFPARAVRRVKTDVDLRPRKPLS